MTNDKGKTWAIVLSTLGTIFILAMAFGVLPFSYALFAGIACYILAGTVRKLHSKEQD